MIAGAFPKIKGRILFDEPLSGHTTFRVGGSCRVWTEPSSEGELLEILRYARTEKKKAFIIGKGSNILFRDKGFGGVLIHLAGAHFKKIKFSGEKVRTGAGAALARVVNMACEKGLSGIEGLVGIPGTVGGAIFMNSSYRGSISDSLEEVKVMDRKTGDMRIIKRKEFIFGYRDTGFLHDYVILEATLKLQKQKKTVLLARKKIFLETKKKEQPIGFFSAGCIFKNPKRAFPAARYIDELRLKGKKIGGAQISEKHANFIVNLKDAKGSDILRLMKLVTRRVKMRFGVKLEPEIKIV
ncbi:MAG: UDP-N-acetylmuramate dehydrogenase [Omnitrophica bacterium]|nr:UDP-N-acetylmuramate dehydrogenase [Candidatus Omnitrophota bacterium]